MDELEISGRRYISSVRAAKEHKYHSDYIGQLVRGGKVVGQKVGRAWYVDADSLAEYLGKEIPPRGPVAQVKEKISAFVVEDQMEESSGRPVAELVEVRGLLEDFHQGQSKAFSPDLSELELQPAFIMPLRKMGRQHVIAAIETAPVTKVVEEKIEELIEESQEAPAEVALTQAEETYIPLKINKEPANLYAEPEDSFYKVSRKGLHYVSPQTAAVIAPHAPAARKSAGARVMAAASILLAAGIVSLGAGVLMSYYLHSITTVANAGQTSSVILSN